MIAEEAVLEADNLVREGIRLAAAQRRPEAIERLSKALEAAPEHPFGLLHLAVVLAGEGRYEEAFARLRRALELRPDSAAFHLFAGRIYFDASDHAAARQALARALELHPENDLAQGYAILNEWESGSPDAAERLDPGRLPDSTPFMARLLMLVERELKGRSVDYIDAARVTPLFDRPRIGYLLWRAMLARKRADLPMVSGFAEMVLEIQPGHVAAVRMLQECRQAALDIARRRVAEEPRLPMTRLELAGTLADLERFSEAAAELDEARRFMVEGGDEASTRAPEVLRLAGRIAYGQGRIEEALELTQAGAEPGFGMAETNYYLGLCHLALGNRPLCLEAFEALVSKVHWAVPLRLREYLSWRQGQGASPRT